MFLLGRLTSSPPCYSVMRLQPTTHMAVQCTQMHSGGGGVQAQRHTAHTHTTQNNTTALLTGTHTTEGDTHRINTRGLDGITPPQPQRTARHANMAGAPVCEQAVLSCCSKAHDPARCRTQRRERVWCMKQGGKMQKCMRTTSPKRSPAGGYALGAAQAHCRGPVPGGEQSGTHTHDTHTYTHSTAS